MRVSQHTAAELAIRKRLAAHGRITFADFMALALYAPGGGYYTCPRPLGPAGDFYTSPHVHPAFGALLARFVTSLSGVPRAVVELGAGDGRLAADVVAAAPSLSYTAIDLRSPPTASVPLGQGSVEWLITDRIPLRNFGGVVLANELLDAMPVHRVTVRGGELAELYVTQDGDALVERPGPPSTPALAERLGALGVRLGEGHIGEVNLRMGEWLAGLSSSLARGCVLLIDYGHDAPDYYAQERSKGTLRCYYQHTLAANPFVHVGRQDIGAHVEFTTLRAFAADEGFAVAGDMTQRDFLRNLGLEAARDAVMRTTDPQSRRANDAALDHLVAPDGLGDFRVIALTKDVAHAPLPGFDPDAPLEALPPVRPLSMGTPMPSWAQLLE